MEISKFVNAHGAWKMRLKTAITTGTADITPAQLAVDNRCEFGKFLYELPKAALMSPLGKSVRDKHAEFHREAARVLELALSPARRPKRRRLSSPVARTSSSRRN